MEGRDSLTVIPPLLDIAFSHKRGYAMSVEIILILGAMQLIYWTLVMGG